MAIGLVQQAVELRKLRTQQVETGEQLSFAVRFAVAWRIAMACLIAGCVIADLLRARRILELPMSEEFHWPVQISLYSVLQVCMIVVLISSVWQYKIDIARPTRLSRSVAAWALGTVWLLAMLPQFSTIPFLVHTATQSIETAHPLRFHRAGTFPDHQFEGFRTFWITFAATASLFLAGLCCVRATIDRVRGQRASRVLPLLYGTLFVAAAVYCGWYYGREFHRISPDMASVSRGVSWFDWLCAATLVSIMTTAGAYRASTNSTIVRLAPEPSSTGAVERPIHETFPILLLLIIEAGWQLFGWIKVIVLQPAGLSTMDVLQYLLTNPAAYLSAAMALIACQLSWLRWRHRRQPTGWKIAVLDGNAFFWNWILFAAFWIVGVLVLSAYSFVYWLGPWWRY